MKQLLLLLLAIPLLTGCPSGKNSPKDDVEAFRKNDYNFTDLKKRGYKNITFKLPEAFESDPAGAYTYRNNAFKRQHYALGVIFSVERFTESDLNSTLFEEEIIDEDLLNGFHDAYVNRRVYSLYNSGRDFKQYLGKHSRHKGITQTVAGETSRGYNRLYYTIATLRVKQEYYTFQIIAPKEMMDYVCDDFYRILASVKS